MGGGVAGAWHLARNQFAVGRRFFRFFRFMGAWERAWGVFDHRSGSGFGLGLGFEDVLMVGKFTFLGCYLGCESATMVRFFFLLFFF